MIVFVTCLRHPERSNNYDHVEKMLEDTLNSVCSQQSGDFRVIVVAYKLPYFAPRENVDFVLVDYPPPKLTKRRVSLDDVRIDKGIKLATGISYAKEKYNPSHVVIFDADDFVSNRIAGFLSEQSADTGFYIDVGYIYSESDKSIYVMNEFNIKCGTSMIYPTKLLKIPPYDPNDQMGVVNATGISYCANMYGSHLRGVRHFENIGHPLKPFPFPGAVYRVDTGQNHSNNSEEKKRNSLKFEERDDFYREFSVPR